MRQEGDTQEGGYWNGGQQLNACYGEQWAKLLKKNVGLKPPINKHLFLRVFHVLLCVSLKTVSRESIHVLL